MNFALFIIFASKYKNEININRIVLLLISFSSSIILYIFFQYFTQIKIKMDYVILFMLLISNILLIFKRIFSNKII